MALNLEIVRDGTAVKVWIDVYIPNYETRRFPLHFECATEAYAGLLTQRIAAAFGNAIEEARSTAYEEGYKDGRAKRSRASWQSRSL